MKHFRSMSGGENSLSFEEENRNLKMFASYLICCLSNFEKKKKKKTGF